MKHTYGGSGVSNGGGGDGGGEAGVADAGVARSQDATLGEGEDSGEKSLSIIGGVGSQLGSVGNYKI